MEHGFNASTFAGRTVASTLCPLSMSLSACVGALFGPLHGGADEAAYRMALAIGDPAKAPAWVDAQLAAKEKIMGLGHREYRVVDPRAVILKPMALELAKLKGQESVVATLIAVDEHAEKRFLEQGKRIRANVEFYKGAVFAALGIPPEFFTALFTMARAFGWGAHMLELWDDHKLYRPAAVYEGAPPRKLG
jgi:citrate synthase